MIIATTGRGPNGVQTWDGLPAVGRFNSAGYFVGFFLVQEIDDSLFEMYISINYG